MAAQTMTDSAFWTEGTVYLAVNLEAVFNFQHLKVIKNTYSTTYFNLRTSRGLLGGLGTAFHLKR